MTKKEIIYLLKHYHYIIEAIEKGEKFVKIEKSGRKYFIEIDYRILKFTEIFKKVYYTESNNLIKNFIEVNVIHGRKNLAAFAGQPLDRSTYFRYKKEFIDKLYHFCILEGLVNYIELLNEKIIV